MNNKAVSKDPTTQRESFTELLEQLAQNSAAVVRADIELVIRRIRDKARAGRRAVVLVAAGAVISGAAFLSLCAAAIIGLTSYMAPSMAALVTGAVLAFIGVVIACIGIKQLKQAILKT
jgi:protein-S-isoprenylcysteine O-methyltransferase Ste14